MTTAKWAIEHVDNIVTFFHSHGVYIHSEIAEKLAKHIDDEIPGYCDDCDEKDHSEREPSAAEEARMMGEDRG